MKKQSRRTVAIIDRERERLQEAGFKLYISQSADIGYYYEKKIGRYLYYFADPQDDNWQVDVIVPGGSYHTIRHFKNISDLLASADKAVFKI